MTLKDILTYLVQPSSTCWSYCKKNVIQLQMTRDQIERSFNVNQ